MPLFRIIVSCFCILTFWQSSIATPHFRENAGQWDSEVLFGITVNGIAIGFEVDGVRWSHADGLHYRTKWVGARKDLKPVGEDVAETCVTYIKSGMEGFHPLEFQIIRYDEVWPGIDLVYHFEEGQLKYDLVLEPGADPKQIKFAFEGLKKVKVLDDGRLELTHDSGKFHDAPPFSYQLVDGEVIEVPSEYKDNSQGEVGFCFPKGFDPSWALIIDPVSIEWSTYLGGDLGDGSHIRDIVLDEEGYIYGTGYAFEGFPTTPGAFNTAPNGNGSVFLDAIVFKMDPTGSNLIWATYFGGERGEHGKGISLDPQGNVYIAGMTYSTDLPVPPGAAQPQHGDGIFGNMDGFAAKFSPDGSNLLYATYFGGLGNDIANAIDVNAAGEAFVGGYTVGGAIPTTPGAFDETFNGAVGFADSFVFRLNSDGTAFIYSTFVGGSQSEHVVEIIVNDQDEASFTGEVSSPNYPTSNNAVFSNKTGTSACAYASRLSADGSQMVASTFLCGNSGDHGEGLALAANGDFYVTGRTYSPIFPTTPGAHDSTFGGNMDGFLAHISADATTLYYATYIGEASQQSGTGVRVNAAGEAYVTGNTNNINWTTTTCALDSTFNGGGAFWGGDIFLNKYDSTGSNLLYSTLLGGSHEERIPSIELVDPVCGESVIIAASINSPNFPTTTGAFQEQAPLSPGYGAITKITEYLDVSIGIAPDSCPGVGDAITLSADIQGCGYWSDLSRWRWDLGDGTVLDDSTVVTHSYQGTGSYPVRLFRPHCPEVVAERVIDIQTFDLGPDRSLCRGEEIYLDATQAWAVAYQWYDGASEPIHLIDKEGTLYVDLWNSEGCKVTDSVHVTLLGEEDIEPPNAFSPNGDGINDVFFVSNLGTGQWELLIYDRWGKQHYLNTNYQNDWDGDELPEGVYYYVLKSFSGCGRKVGHVTLLR